MNSDGQVFADFFDDEEGRKRYEEALKQENKSMDELKAARWSGMSFPPVKGVTEDDVEPIGKAMVDDLKRRLAALEATEFADKIAAQQSHSSTPTPDNTDNRSADEQEEKREGTGT